VRRGEPRDVLDAKLELLDRTLEGQAYLSGREYGLADIAYVPWVLRAVERFDVELAPALAGWLEGLLARPAIAAEREVVAAL
jgi:glutathione S-transferase